MALPSLKGMEDALFVEGGWVDKLFSGYTLLPVFGDDGSGVDLLTRKSLFRALLELFIRRANIASVIGSLTGSTLLTQLLKGSDGAGKKNIIEEAYEILDAHQREKLTINDKIKSIYNDLAGQKQAFGHIQAELAGVPAPKNAGYSYLTSLYANIESIDKKVVNTRGVLCSIESLRKMRVGDLPDRLKGTSIRWILTDFPPFALGQDKFRGGVALVSMNSDVLDRLEELLPFSREVGWYPYIRITGTCRYPYSPKYTYPSIDVAWIEYRPPTLPEKVQPKIAGAYSKHADLADSGLGVSKTNPFDLLLLRDILKILAAGVNKTVDKIDFFRELSDEAHKCYESCSGDSIWWSWHVFDVLDRPHHR